ncbi:MAG: hypothetical protein CMI54_01410 [Parcubacteria group bacterium]|nr:hypothetical protein [Parcubacteria group bacterium]|tara:strand:- start:641 stop:1162 length:522 start_codon:yes stop_codon:yes gene_type:complete
MKTIKHVLKSNAQSIEAWTKKYLQTEDYCTETGKEAYITISFNKGVMRTSALNSLAAVYYRTISEHTGDCRTDVKAFCKMKFGIDLLKELGEEDTTAGYKASDTTEVINDVGFYRWNYEAKIKFMKTIYITSLMTSKIFCEYLKQIEAYYMQSEGLRLESINETLRNNALNIK